MNKLILDSFVNYDHLGYHNPYYFKSEDGTFVIKKNLSETLSVFNNSNIVDPLAVIELLNKKYLLGDRTLVKQIYRTPWMAIPDNDLRSWSYAKIPNHFENVLDEVEIAQNLFTLICEEISSYTKDKDNIGILLSGGMDSRIVAGTLNYLMSNNLIPKKNICALTWGNLNSRDVVYSKIIAEKLNWEWKHYEVTGEFMLQNVEETAKRGCEFSPIHLHAIPQIRDDNDLDCILAGSYGDSIGRGEYHNNNVLELKGVEKNFRNINKLVTKKVYKENAKGWQADLALYHSLYPQAKSYQVLEQDYQLHYMRRMLNPCMDLISEKMPFYQVFTNPKVFGYMWSIHPSLRTDNIYKILLTFIENDLSNIPWARTGLIFGEKIGVLDNFTKSHHSYGRIISNDIYKEINELILNGNLKRIGIFNMDSISSILRLIKGNPANNFDYLEKLIWLASFSKMIELYNLKSDYTQSTKLIDTIAGKFMSPLGYMTKVNLRKFIS